MASDFAYDHQIVSAKFDEELANHLELQRSGSTHNSLRAGPIPIVRLLPRPSHLQRNGSLSLTSHEVLPPCLFCLRARHALRLLGRDGEPLHQGPPSGSQRYLESQHETSFTGRCYSDHLDDVVRSTIGRDPSACASCEFRGGQQPDSCLEHLRYVNLFENRILFYKPLDLSLHDALRWWKGERRPLAAPRCALRAIEARLRRWQRRYLRALQTRQASARFSISGSASICSSRRCAGSRRSTRRGIPHLDINPENICLKVLRGRIHAQLIDLGMAANPRFTAKDQYEKRLWPRRADFAAEECQRLSIFLDRQLFIQIATHQLASRIPLCRGDQLHYENPDCSRNTMLFEVCPVCRGRSASPDSAPFRFCARSMDQFARAQTPAGLQPDHPQRGPAADVFSMGMVLASLLMQDTSGDELRRELGKIDESLFSHWQSDGPDRVPIPGRVLVRRVLSRPDEHSRWFRDRVEALRSYRDATPLAEELLGIALRALLRSNHHHPYLEDRGGDARLALQRLRH